MSSEQLSDEDWDDLLATVSDKECTPFIGAGACTPTIPLASDLAEQWAARWRYPLTDSNNLARVAQYLAIERNPLFPKRQLRRLLRQIAPPDFSQPDEPHRALADLELPLYITTNYDGFMLQALEHRNASPRRELCAWNELVRAYSPSELDNGYSPSTANPLVYHLHGHYNVPQSMVLTENDYLSFLVLLSKDGSAKLLPSAIRQALAGTSLLFVGYSLSDWNFRVLFRGLIGGLGRTLGMTSIAVQLEQRASDDTAEGRARMQHYLIRYFEQIQTIPVRLYWGDVRQFAAELRARWDDYRGDGGD